MERNFYHERNLRLTIHTVIKFKTSKKVLVVESNLFSIHCQSIVVWLCFHSLWWCFSHFYCRVFLPLREAWQILRSPALVILWPPSDPRPRLATFLPRPPQQSSLFFYHFSKTKMPLAFCGQSLFVFDGHINNIQ